ncbi:MAG: Box C/D RNA-guided RNA methyltransferase subunit Nop5 [Candidatus Methanosuratincola subterraneus]|jgi:nucleolar protein 56|uniref:Box C/D RNA-guided RNA methyltransferase subunit Nop5 n=1 Tax=Methanosuratincola subterraneus TaxID=2593994 RepID=A0A444L5N3_METS7|nr:MAG: Box C/D RNA-guided RNA methyltransferase subunit Nop5 [Candidatus Methanosuratincola subterraneus]
MCVDKDESGVIALKCYVVDSFGGFFAYDESLKLIASRIFESSSDATSQILDLEKKGLSRDLEVLVHDLVEMGCDELVFEDELEAKAIRTRFGVKSHSESPSPAGTSFRASPLSAFLSAGKKQPFMDRLLRETSESIVRTKIKAASEKRDRLVAQAVSALDEIDKNVNITVSRVREWYGLHFPELDSLVPDHRQYMEIVKTFGRRSNIDPEAVSKVVQAENRGKAIYEAAMKSMGAEVNDYDLKQIVDLAEINLKTYESRDSMEKYIDEVMKEIAPNVRELAGATLGARLIALAGSLENLAKKPASTIQVLGAEKALFRSLKTGARPPKHGIIFQHQYLHSAERWQRGKIARALAGKLSIAARVDAFGGEFIADKLKSSVEKRIAEIKKKYAKPPARPAKQERSFKRFRKEKRRNRRW